MAGARSIAAAQTIPLRGDVEANVERHTRLAHAAANAHARLLVFPELSLTGYELDLAGELAFSENDTRLEPMRALARSLGITLVVGAPVGIGARLHIGAFIISPDGTVDAYTKHHLGAFGSDANPGGAVPPAEDSVFHPGDRNPLVQIGHDVTAVAVCADVGRPSHPHDAANRGATTYVASMFVIPSALENDTTALQSYAVEHRMAVVFANYGGPSGGLPSGGGSAIWSERGELLAQLPKDGEGVVVATEDEDGWRAVSLDAGGRPL
jgi:predicted amidohydrolase